MAALWVQLEAVLHWGHGGAYQEEFNIINHASFFWSMRFLLCESPPGHNKTLPAKSVTDEHHPDPEQ